MKSFQMLKVTPFACAAVMMMMAAACTNASETEVDEEGDQVATDQQELITDGQVCLSVQRGTSGQVEDATLWQSAPIWTADVNERLKTGNSPEGGYARSLLRFDLGAVPAGATVVSADLTLTQVYKEGPDATVDVLRSTGAWSEGTVTWDSFGGAFDPTPVASFTAEGDGGLGALGHDLRRSHPSLGRAGLSSGVLDDNAPAKPNHEVPAEQLQEFLEFLIAEATIGQQGDPHIFVEDEGTPQGERGRSASQL